MLIGTQEIALLDFKPLLVNQATHVLAGRNGTGEMLAVILDIRGIATLRSVVVAWKQASIGNFYLV